MPSIKLSQIAPAAGPPAPTDTLISVLGGNTDAQVSLNQLLKSLPGAFINAATEFNVSTTGDQTTNIQSAVNAASVSSGRAIVVLPAGTLSISDQIFIPAGITLMGQGLGATILQETVTTDHALIFLGSRGTIRDLAVTVSAGRTVTHAIIMNGTGIGECEISRVNIDNSIGGGTLSNGITFAGASGGYFNRIADCRIAGCSSGVTLSGPNALEALLSNLNISQCGIGINAIASSGYFSMVKVETNSCTDCGLFSLNCNYEAVDCLMDNSGNFGWFSDFSTTTGMPITGWYLRLVNCRGSTTLNTGGNNHGLASNGMGFHIGNSGAGGGSILDLNMAGCGSYNNAVYGINVTAPSTPANTRVMISSSGSFTDAVAANGDGMYFNFCHLAISGCGAFNAGNGVHLADGIMIDTGCTGRVTGCIGSNNTGQNVNITAASAVLGENNESTNTRTVAQLPSASAVGAGSRGFITDAVALRGTFTLAAAVSTVVSNAGTPVVADIALTPTNAAAATLQGSAKALYVSAVSSGVSFTVSTGNATAAVGTETFDYIIRDTGVAVTGGGTNVTPVFSDGTIWRIT